MVPLYLARIEDLGRGDLVKVDCAACHHVALLTPEFLLRLGLSPRPRCSISRSGSGAAGAERGDGRRVGQVRASERLTDACRDNQHAPGAGLGRARLWQHNGSQRSGPPDRCAEPERQERDQDQRRSRVRPIIGGGRF
jgi:hypothetical protein